VSEIIQKLESEQDTRTDTQTDATENIITPHLWVVAKNDLTLVHFHAYIQAVKEIRVDIHTPVLSTHPRMQLTLPKTSL